MFNVNPGFIYRDIVARYLNSYWLLKDPHYIQTTPGMNRVKENHPTVLKIVDFVSYPNVMPEQGFPKDSITCKIWTSNTEGIVGIGGGENGYEIKTSLSHVKGDYKQITEAEASVYILCMPDRA